MRMLTSTALALSCGVLVLALLLPVPAQAQQPTLSVSNVMRLQPGWIRVYLAASNAPSGATYQLTPVCDTTSIPLGYAQRSADATSITTTQAKSSKNLAFDIQVSSAWVPYVQPCHITQLNASMLSNGVVVAQSQTPVDAQMDLPLSFIWTQNIPLWQAVTTGGKSVLTSGPVSLSAPSPYAAYPPVLIEIASAVGKVGFAEVEALSSRKTVGLRGLVVDESGSYYHELGGGGEIPDGWGLDITTLGIWRAPQLPIETSNPGHDVFAYSGTIQPPILSPDIASQKLFPDPNSADYSTLVLNNRGVPRCWSYSSTGCMDITYTYDDKGGTLNAINNAAIRVLTPPPITLNGSPVGPSPQIKISKPSSSPAPAGVGNAIMGVPASVLAAVQALANAPGRDLNAVTAMRTALDSSKAHPVSKASTRDRSLVKESPQERAISQRARPHAMGVPVVSSPAASCVVNAAKNGVTQTPSKCQGMTGHSFACPTGTDTIKVETLGHSTSSTDLAAVSTFSPYWAGASDNLMGTCGSHAATQYFEALLAKYSDDLAIKRVIYVSGDPVVVPEPRVAISITGGIVQLYTWENTHAGDPPNNPWPNDVLGQDWTSHHYFPQYPLAYWPAIERDWKAWYQKNGNIPNPPCPVDPKTGDGNFWGDGFCMGQGQPAPGVYYAHSQMVAGLHKNPLREHPWSLATSFFDTVTTGISLDDRDAAIQAVIKQIRLGLPVALGFPSGPTKFISDGSGVCTPPAKSGDSSTGACLTYLYGQTWYLPPEMGGCDSPTLDAIYGPGNGHAVNIVGYWITGTSASPDPFSSYFIIQNNWGGAFYFMNFAAFKYLASGLSYSRLNRTCHSVACAKQPLIHLNPGLIKSMLYPPDPESSTYFIYKKVVDWARDNLGGTAGE
jgi:hypothetical protein